MVSELPGTAGITLQETDYGRIALGASDELFQRELSWKIKVFA